MGEWERVGNGGGYPSSGIEGDHVVKSLAASGEAVLVGVGPGGHGPGEGVVDGACDGFVIAIFAPQWAGVFGEAGDSEVGVVGLVAFGWENANVVVEVGGGGGTVAHGEEGLAEPVGAVAAAGVPGSVGDAVWARGAVFGVAEEGREAGLAGDVDVLEVDWVGVSAEDGVGQAEVNVLVGEDLTPVVREGSASFFRCGGGRAILFGDGEVDRFPAER